MVHKAPFKIYARGVVSYFYFSRAPRARALKIWQINSAILKVPDGALLRQARIPAAEQFSWNLRCLTEQCTIGNLYIEIDDTGHFLQGALCTIAALPGWLLAPSESRAQVLLPGRLPPRQVCPKAETALELGVVD
jgi:hypothetical protein